MDRDTWIARFAAVLVELRPYLTEKVALRHAIAAYDGTDADPEAAARAYLFDHGATLPAVPG